MDIGKLMKQAKKMQQEMVKIQEKLADERIEASAGGGAVKVVVNGKQELLDIKIDPSVVDPDDIEMLQDLVLAAANEALQQSRDLAAQRVNSVTGGMGIPGLT
ncbi:MAG: YbaB/EbfC family nucleoid-associated protein [Candidatus Oleimmundimicrobium sp.]|nr:YbaB/EbfC family nucleoid-associated protein [Candidatus Oleimmundimicrobium sp.]